MKIYNLNEITEKRIIGRNVADAGKTEEPLALFWGASGLEINVKAKEVWVKFVSLYNNFEPWVSVDVNGYPVNRFMVPSEGSIWICVAANMNSQKENRITILKDTQPMSGEELHSLFIEQIGLSDEGEFCPLNIPRTKIEFIGDSITSGEGLAGGPEEFDWITQWFCASKSYAVQAAKALNAQWSVVSQCGWGICWGWDGNTHTALPPHYENVCSVMWSDFQKKLGAHQKYDFNGGSDFVVINLGTNDNGAFFQPAWKDENGVEHPLSRDSNDRACEKDGEKVAEGVYNFLKTVRKNNPSAKIIWVWGMIKLVAIPDFILRGVEKFKNETGDNQVYTLELDAMEDVEKLPEHKGSRGHPGPETHRLAAKKIVDFIKKISN